MFRVERTPVSGEYKNFPAFCSLIFFVIYRFFYGTTESHRIDCHYIVLDMDFTSPNPTMDCSVVLKIELATEQLHNSTTTRERKKDYPWYS
jgi:hypothetical protein